MTDYKEGLNPKAEDLAFPGDIAPVESVKNPSYFDKMPWRRGRRFDEQDARRIINREIGDQKTPLIDEVKTDLAEFIEAFRSAKTKAEKRTAIEDYKKRVNDDKYATWYGKGEDTDSVLQKAARQAASELRGLAATELKPKERQRLGEEMTKVLEMGRDVVRAALDVGKAKSEVNGGGAKEPPKKPDVSPSPDAGADGGEKRPPRVAPPDMQWRDPKNIPSVILSDYEWYAENAKISPNAQKEFLRDEETGERFDITKPDTLNGNQAVFACLKYLNEAILESNPVIGVKRSGIQKYVSRLNDLGDERAQDLLSLVQAVFKLQDVWYKEWVGDGGAKGGKSKGIQNITPVTDELDDDRLWCFLQDPAIAKAAFLIKGPVVDNDFIRGKSGRASGEEISGGFVKGAAEKIGNELGSLYWLRMLDGSAEAFSISYTASVLNYPLEFYNRGEAGQSYDRYIQILIGMGEGYSNPDRNKQILFTYDTKVPPSAFNNRAAAKFNLDNFYTEDAVTHIVNCSEEFAADNFGWKNVGRVLALLSGDSYRDPRSQMTRPDGSFIDGVYTIDQFLFASSDRQIEMAKAAYKLFRVSNVLDGDSRLRILRVNGTKAYYYRECAIGQEIDGVGWKRAAILDFNEGFTDSKGYEHKFVDIGSFNKKRLGFDAAGSLLNKHYVDVGYAYKVQDNALDHLCAGKSAEGLLDILKFMETQDAFRHLSEQGGNEPEGRSVDLDYERQQAILKSWEMVSEMIYDTDLWEKRIHGRERLTWAKHLNEVLRAGFDKVRYRREFASCFIEGKEWTGLINSPLSSHEKVAKLLGKLERPEVWNVWLKQQGVYDLMKTMFPQAPNGWDVPNEWREVGINDFWEYLSYNAIASFAGYEVEKVYKEKDQYGNLVPRVKFKKGFGFGDEKPGMSEEIKRKYRKRGSGYHFLENVLSPLGLSEVQKTQAWDGMTDLFLGETAVGRMTDIIKSGKLNDPFFSPLSQLYEKSQEEFYVDHLIEEYLQATFDKRDENWIRNKWGKVLKSKQRWDTWALFKRQMKYSVGSLSEEDFGGGRKGYFVHDQLQTDKQGKILVNDKGIPMLEMKDAAMAGYDRTASMCLGTAGVWRPKAEMMAPITKTEGRLSKVPIIGGLFKDGKLDELERWRRAEYEGMGDAGETAQVSWMPIYYDKKMMLNFFMARFFDPAYRYEQAVNGGENWYSNQCHMGVADFTQQIELINQFEVTVGEDHNWVADLMKDFFGNPEDREFNLLRYKEAKKTFRIPNIESKASYSEDKENDFLKLQTNIFQALPLGKYFPVVGNVETLKSRLIPSAVVGIPVYLAAQAAGLTAIGTFGGFVPYAVAILAYTVVGGLYARDPKVDGNKAQEQAGFIFSGGYITLPFIKARVALGMAGKRMLKRSLSEMVSGLDPVWDSALPMEQFAKMAAEYKKELEPVSPVAGRVR